MAMAAWAVHVRIACDEQRLADAAQFVRKLAQQAHAVGLHSAMNEAICCHARLLIARGERDEAAARVCFVVGHAQSSARDQAAAGRVGEVLALSDAELAHARERAQRLDFDVLLADAARASAGTHG